LRIFASIVAALVITNQLQAAPIRSTKASDLYHRAQKLEKAGNIVQAYTLYAEAAALEPKNQNYKVRAGALQAKAIALQRLVPPPAAAAAAAASSDSAAANDAPDSPTDSAADFEYTNLSARELAKARQMLPPPTVKLTSGQFDFHFSGSSNDLFNTVAQRCGLQTVFDSDYNQLPQKVRFDIDDVDCRTALRAVEAATSSFVVPLSSKLILISKDSTVKRTANEQTMSIVFPIPTAMNTQDLTEISQAVRQVSGIEKLSWNSATNEIVIRDRVSRVLVAKALLDQLVSYRGDVVIDLRFLQLSDMEMLSYGVNLTNTFNLIWGANPMIAAAGGPLNTVIRALRHGFKTFGITVLEANVVAQLTQSSARTILQTQIRSLNGLPASLHVGQKYPVLSSGYYGGTPNTSTANAYTPPASFTYFDLGVSMKVTPIIGNEDVIIMDVDTEYQLLAGQAINGIPVLASRKLTSRVSLHNDEWAVIGGLMDQTQDKSISGVAWLARLPVLGWLFRTQNHEKDRDHIVIVMKPHLMGEPPSTHETAPMAVGTETRGLSPL
jgi:type II secretory pathway component GspD/PulD (secretin)